jgi:FtsP/CotA-like multicopper oxidase with cupredoxin domain
MMGHPFHVHGVRFRVVHQNGRTPRPENSGWKDTVLVEGETELLVRFDHGATPANPYMMHCHILEHEDAGMMAQFAVG